MRLDLPAFDKEGEGAYICNPKTSFLHVRREEGVSENQESNGECGQVATMTRGNGFRNEGYYNEPSQSARR